MCSRCRSIITQPPKINLHTMRARVIIDLIKNVLFFASKISIDNASLIKLFSQLTRAIRAIFNCKFFGSLLNNKLLRQYSFFIIMIIIATCRQQTGEITKISLFIIRSVEYSMRE